MVIYEFRSLLEGECWTIPNDGIASVRIANVVIVNELVNLTLEDMTQI